MLSRIAERHGDSRSAKLLQESLERLRSARIDVAVFGEFKRGKSSLINALLGQELVPTGVLPVTSICTRIQYGDPPRACIAFEDGSSAEEPLEIVEAYVSEQKNPENVKKVLAVDLFAPSELLRGGLCLVDTPGTGSLYEHNSTVTKEYLDRADAAIFVTSADAPISSREIEIVSELSERYATVIPVVTKIDRLSPAEAAEVEAFTEKALQPVLGGGTHVHLVSSKQESSGLDALKTYLLEMASSEKFAETSFSANKKLLRKVAGSLAQLIELKLKALALPLEELQSAVEKFSSGLAAISQQKDDELFLVQEREKRRVLSELEQDLTQFMTSRYRVALEQIAGQQPSNYGALIRRANQAMPDIVERDFAEFQEHETAILQGKLRAINETLSGHSKKWLDEIQSLSQSTFACQIPVNEAVPELGSLTRFWVKRWYARVEPNRLYLALSRATPRNWWKGYFNSLLGRKLWELYDMNCGNMRYEFQRKLDSALTKYIVGVRDWLDGVQQSIESSLQDILQVRRSEQAKIDAERESLERDLEGLKNLAV